MKNYKKSRVYKIWCDIDGIDEIYVGSSADFKKRCDDHFQNCYNSNLTKYNLKLYVYIRDNGGFGNFTIQVLEKVSCENNLQLRQREQYWINKLSPSLNGKKAYISNEERLQEQLIRSTQNYNDNKEAIELKRKKVIQCSNCDKTYTMRNKAQHQKTQYCLNFKKSI